MSIRTFLNRLGRGMLALAALVVVAVAWSVADLELTERFGQEAALMQQGQNDTLTSVKQDGWGSEVLQAIYANGVLQSPIRLANACGLGASSCFKCHNGSRAEKPKMDPATSPWHTQHATVNNSCAGCHRGNPRIIKKEVAHANLVADPRSPSAELCTACHSGGDAADLLKSYQSIAGGGK